LVALMRFLFCCGGDLFTTNRVHLENLSSSPNQALGGIAS
jgi:hypothetical protein